MADRLEIDNQQQRLIGNHQAMPRGPQRQRNPRRSAETNIVVNAGEKRYLWTARAFAVVVAISLCCNLILILAIAQLIPLYRIEPFLLTFENKDEQVYEIQPINNMIDRKAITEVFVREYVLLRSAIVDDVKEMEARWMPGSRLEEMSSPVVYQNFVQKTANKAFEIIREKGLSRTIHIISVNELGRGLWQVEYSSEDMTADSPEPQYGSWTASLAVTYRRKAVKYSERLNNPTGFTVTKYSLARNKIDD